MARRSKSILDYQKLAESKDLIFVGDTSPRYTTESTTWECKHCGRRMRKPYTSVKGSKNSCQCRWHTLTANDYHHLAANLGIKWIGSLPPNVRTQTNWLSAAGNFAAAYNELAYKIPNRLKEYVD